MQARRIFGDLALAFAIMTMAIGCALPTRMLNPVAGADTRSWNPQTFWHYPWGTSGVHKGIDIFKPAGTPVVASQSGIVVWRGQHPKGGNMIYMLGPLLRLHYYAHLLRFELGSGRYVSKGDTLGYVGNTGNAMGKASHLHYHIITLLPYPWRITRERQGWKKMFYLDPGKLIKEGSD